MCKVWVEGLAFYLFILGGISSNSIFLALYHVMLALPFILQLKFACSSKRTLWYFTSASLLMLLLSVSMRQLSSWGSSFWPLKLRGPNSPPLRSQPALCVYLLLHLPWESVLFLILSSLFRSEVHQMRDHDLFLSIIHAWHLMKRTF